MSDQSEILQKLRTPFPDNQISKLPKPHNKDAQKGYCKECGGYHGLPAVHLDYVGHAALTARLLDVDINWTWEPVAFDANGLPAIDKDGGLWIRLTVGGMTRLGYGDAPGKTGGNATKERIGDALRNAAMRFGVALDLWHKGDLYLDDEPEAKPEEPAIKKPLGGKGLTAAIASIHSGEYTTAQLTAEYSLTEDQLTLINDEFGENK
jgi:hypothetical protein